MLTCCPNVANGKISHSPGKKKEIAVSVFLGLFLCVWEVLFVEGTEWQSKIKGWSPSHDGYLQQIKGTTHRGVRQGG